MGQFFLIVNIDKQEYLNPSNFGEGLKAREHGNDRRTISALHALLTKSDCSGGGDYIKDPHGTIGSWAGDRIVIIGDYDSSGLFGKAYNEFKEISGKIIPILIKNYPEDWKGTTYD